MDDLDADIKLEAGGEEVGVQYKDPLLVPTPVLLYRREVHTRYPQATVNQLHRVTEDTLVYRQHSQLSCQLPGAPKSTFLMVFSPDGSKVASTHGDHNIYVSEVKTGQCICTLEGHPRTPWCVAFHPASNDIIASGCLGGVVRVWDLKGGSEVWTSERKINIASLAFHPTDQVLVIATFNEIYFWDWFQPQPFAKICTADEKEKVRYVKFDPLGHKLITGIAYTPHDRASQGSSRIGGSSSGSFLSRSELVEREQQLSHSYNQLSSQYINLVSRFEALTSRAFNSVPRVASRIDRGTDPIEPPPATTGRQSLLNQARQFAQQVTEGRRGTTQSQDSSAGESSRNRSTWAPTDGQGGRDSQSSNEMNIRLEEDYGLSAVRTLRQIISDDSASSSSLDSSSSATSGASGVSERNTRLSLLWTSRLHRPGQDSDSAGEASSVYSLGDTGMLGGSGDQRTHMGGEEGINGTRANDISGAERRNYRGIDDRASGDDDPSNHTSLNLRSTGSQSERTGTLWGYFSNDGPVIPAGRSRTTRESRSESVLGDSPSNEIDGVSVVSNGVGPEDTQDSIIHSSAGSSEMNSSGLNENNLSTLGDSQLGEMNPTRTVSSRESHGNQRDLPSMPSMPWMLHNPSSMSSDPIEDHAVPGPSGLSGISQSQMSSPAASSRYPTSSTLDPQFGVQLLSRHIENMQRICIAHLEITRHRHEILRLQQIRSMLTDIQHQIHSLRMSVDQSMEDLSGPPAEMNNSTSYRGGSNGEEDPDVRPPSLPLIRHWSRTSPRSVARVPRGPFGTRMQSRHSPRSWMMSPSVFRRIPRHHSIRTRLHLPGQCAPLQGTNGTSGGAVGGRISPTQGLVEPGAPTPTPGDGAVIGPLPTPPPDQGHSEEQPRHIVRIVSGNQYGTQTRTMLRYFKRLQQQLRVRQEALEQQELRLRGYLSVCPPSSSTSSSATSSVSLDHEDDPPSPPERYRRAGPPTTSLASRIANMVALQSKHVHNNSLCPERNRHSDPPPTSMTSRTANNGRQQSSDVSSNSLSPEHYQHADPLTTSLTSRSANMARQSPRDVPSNSLNSECSKHVDPPSTSSASRIANTGRQQSRDVPSNSLSSDHYEHADPPTTSSASRIANIGQQQSRDVPSNSLSSKRNRHADPPTTSLTSRTANMGRQQPNDVPSNSFSSEHYQHADPPTTSMTSRIANMGRQQSRDVPSNSLSSKRQRRGLPPSVPLATRSVSMGRQRSSDVSSNSLSFGSQENSRGSSRSETSLYVPPRLLERSSLRSSDRLYDRPHERNLLRVNSRLLNRPYGRFCERWSDTNSDPLSERLHGRNSDGPHGRNSGRNSDRLSNRPYDRSSDSSNPFCYIAPLWPQGRPPTTPPTQPEFSDNEPYSNDFNNNSSQRHFARIPLRQNITNMRRDRFSMAALRFRSMTAVRMRERMWHGFHGGRRDRHRQILQRMADRLNSLVSQEQEHQQQHQQRQEQQHGAGSSMDNHMHNLRLLVRLALHLIYQLLNFICNRDVSYEERPISRLPNPFRVEETGDALDGVGIGLGLPSPNLGGVGIGLGLPSPVALDFEPGLHNLTTLLETVRMASEELRNDSAGDGAGETTPVQESTRPITNVPRRLTDFLRRSGNLAQQQDVSAEPERTRSVGSHNSSSRPQLVIPRITLSDPSGSESQVEEENSPSIPASGLPHNDQAEFGLRSLSGIPLRLLGRQYAVDRRSPDSEDSPGPPDGAQDGPGHPPDPPVPQRGHLTPHDVGLPRGPGSEMLLRPNLQRAPPDRAAEREADNFFSRPYFTAHFGASRCISGSVVTCRIQAWDFPHNRIPDISDGVANVVVGKCKIHNDASVDISADGTMLAALVPESQAMTMVGVYSLEDRSLGQLLYSYIFAPNTICVSLSPMARHLVVGFASNMPRLVPHFVTKQVVAQIYKLCDNPTFHGRGQAGHLQFVRDIEVMNDHRDTSLNCIRWLPYPGQGLIYGNNKGQLNILR
ncbi:uncharacterized protein [Panulirus ornatus]|uniref:uncharacterized protein n=1 Tax=Panulirus ornatus TaxID=150431 RepID=UPI003A8C142C